MSDCTTIIVSNLTRDDFLSNGKNLSLAGNIKLGVLNLSEQPDFSRQVIQWSELPFLCRVVAIFKTPAAAKLAYDYLQSLYGDNALFKLPDTVKLSLQENLLQRSRLMDALNDGWTSKPEETYQEPEPQEFNAEEDLKKLGIDVEKLNQTPPPSGLGRSHSVTKTLFRPDSASKSQAAGESAVPKSPTITLDETF